MQVPNDPVQAVEVLWEEWCHGNQGTKEVVETLLTLPVSFFANFLVKLSVLSHLAPQDENDLIAMVEARTAGFLVSGKPPNPQKR